VGKVRTPHCDVIYRQETQRRIATTVEGRAFGQSHRRALTSPVLADFGKQGPMQMKKNARR
jgi:hypothetical protein